jgi:cytochrome c oxidase subunit IV
MMRDGGNNSRRLLIGPLVAWVALLGLFAVSLGSAYLPLGTGNVVVSLGIAAAMIAVLAAFLMDLRNSTALIRLVAAASGLWIIIMFSLTFADYVSRSYCPRGGRVNRGEATPRCGGDCAYSP